MKESEACSSEGGEKSGPKLDKRKENVRGKGDAREARGREGKGGTQRRSKKTLRGKAGGKVIA